MHMYPPEESRIKEANREFGLCHIVDTVSEARQINSVVTSSYILGMRPMLSTAVLNTAQL